MRSQECTRERHHRLLLRMSGVLAVLLMAGAIRCARAEEARAAAPEATAGAPDTLTLQEVERGLADRFHEMQARREHRARQQPATREYQLPAAAVGTQPPFHHEVGNTSRSAPFAGVQ